MPPKLVATHTPGPQLPPGYAALRMARGTGWTYEDAINMNEDRKVFYLYRGVLIVLVVALPHCTDFLGLELDYLLQLQGTITENQFDKAVWLICNAMRYLDSDIINTARLEAAYTTDVRGGARRDGFIKGFSDERAKQGDHAVIAKSISRIVIRFLFAFSLNLRGLRVAKEVVSPPSVGAGAAAAAGDSDGDAAAGAGDADAVEQQITTATGVLYDMERELPDICRTLIAEFDAIGNIEAKNAFIGKMFEPITDRLHNLGEKFQARQDDIISDITGLTKLQVMADRTNAKARMRTEPSRMSSRTFETRVATLETFIHRSVRGHIAELTSEFEKIQTERETAEALRELLQSAGDTFKGVHPISGIPAPARIQLHGKIFVPRLLEKALVMQGNISKLLLTPVTIAYKPSIQEFLSRIGLLESTTDVEGDDDDDGGGGNNLAKRLRTIIEAVQAQPQCEQTIGKLSKNPSIRCYICGGAPTDVTMECEHIFCIGLAIEYFGLLRCSGLSPEEKQFLSILYAWAHRCCNRLKSNMSFMKVNPNYKAPGVPAQASRDNFFMFHQDNASKLLGDIFSNNTQHDCGIINKGGGSKQAFVAAKLRVVSENVLPLVNMANTVFGTVFAASTVLFTAMSCFKNIASLLVSQAVQTGQSRLTLNTRNMLDGFQSILPGVAIEAGAGGSRMKKNEYIGGMQRLPHETEEQRGQGHAAAALPQREGSAAGGGEEEEDDDDDIRQLLIRIISELAVKKLELGEPAEEESQFDRVRRGQVEEGQPQILCEDENPTRVILQQTNSQIIPNEKYFFLFNLTAITHSLNTMCLYSELLLENEDEDRQTSNIRVFGAICNNYIGHRREGLYTLNDLSVILLCQIAVNGLPNFDNVTRFNVVEYISSRRRDAVEGGPSYEFEKFSTGTKFIFDSMSKDEWPGGPIRNHTGIESVITDQLRDAFMKLCLLRLNRYTECYDTANDLMQRNDMKNMENARNTVNDFIKDDLYLLYCPFDQPKESSILKRNRESTTQGYTEKNETKLFKQANFQKYLTDKNTEYLTFFEFMVDYSDWNFACGRAPVRPHNTGGLDDSGPSASSASPSPKRTISAPAALGLTNPQGWPGYKIRALTTTTSDYTASKGGSSLKKNKHNNTKKYKHRLRKPAKSRRNKSNYKYKNNYTIKRRKSRRNNRSHRK